MAILCGGIKTKIEKSPAIPPDIRAPPSAFTLKTIVVPAADVGGKHSKRKPPPAIKAAKTEIHIFTMREIQCSKVKFQTISRANSPKK